jgi:hypothetical protein
MFESILIIAVIAASVSGVVTYCWLTKSSTSTAASNQKKENVPSAQGPAQQPVPARPTLEVVGAVHPKGVNLSFLRLFGLGYAPVYDLCFLPGPLAQAQLSPLVATTLQTMHAGGDLTSWNSCFTGRP